MDGTKYTHEGSPAQRVAVSPNALDHGGAAHYPKLNTRALALDASTELHRSLRGIDPAVSVGEAYDREQRLGRILRACQKRLRRQSMLGRAETTCATLGCCKAANGYLRIWCAECRAAREVV